MTNQTRLRCLVWLVICIYTYADWQHIFYIEQKRHYGGPDVTSVISKHNIFIRFVQTLC